MFASRTEWILYAAHRGQGDPPRHITRGAHITTAGYITRAAYITRRQGQGVPPRHITFAGACDGENITVEDGITLRSNTSLKSGRSPVRFSI